MVYRRMVLPTYECNIYRLWLYRLLVLPTVECSWSTDGVTDCWNYRLLELPIAEPKQWFLDCGVIYVWTWQSPDWPWTGVTFTRGYLSGNYRTLRITDFRYCSALIYHHRELPSTLLSTVGVQTKGFTDSWNYRQSRCTDCRSTRHEDRVSII